jgi:substrate import-associated zinc metallohydrolase lipoprotein
MKLLKICAFLLVLVAFAACSKKDDLSGVQDIPGLGGDTWAPGPIDQWLLDTITIPYNIDVKYKWDQFEFDVTKTLVPPKEEVVIPAMQAVKKVWIDNYVKNKDLNFFKQYCPKFFALSGSASWNDNGTITLGTAEGGRKVVMYLLNEFRTKSMPGYTLSDTANVKQIMHVIEHEFGHILQQNIAQNVAYKQICAGLYTGNWNNVSDAAARQDGFITAYSMANDKEDYVEMIAMMLIEGKQGYENILASIPDGTSVNGTTHDEAISRLRQKEAMIVTYYKEAYNIDFYSLQADTRKSVEGLFY